MSVVTGSNRRRFQRLDTDFPAAVETSGGRFEGRVQNISQDGCQIEGSTPARVGELFSIAFGKPGARESFRAKITWARPAGAAFQFGCIFWAIDEDAKRQLVMRLIQYSTFFRPKPKPAGETSDPATPEAEGPAEGANGSEPRAAEAPGEGAAGTTPAAPG